MRRKVLLMVVAALMVMATLAAGGAFAGVKGGTNFGGAVDNPGIGGGYGGGDYANPDQGQGGVFQGNNPHPKPKVGK